MSLVLAIVALVLMYPVAIVANITSPKIHNWYSTTSRRRLSRRIAELELRLQESQREWTFTPAEWQILDTEHRTSVIVGVGVLMLMICLLSVLNFGMETWRVWSRHSGISIPSERWLFAIVGLTASSGYLLILAGFMSSNALHRERRDMHTNQGREDLREQIAELKTLDRSRQP